MKEIGKQLKEARESMGISIEEASEDLKIRPSQIENIEAGNKEAFDDIFYLEAAASVAQPSTKALTTFAQFASV